MSPHPTGRRELRSRLPPAGAFWLCLAVQVAPAESGPPMAAATYRLDQPWRPRIGVTERIEHDETSRLRTVLTGHAWTDEQVVVGRLLVRYDRQVVALERGRVQQWLYRFRDASRWIDDQEQRLGFAQRTLRARRNADGWRFELDDRTTLSGSDAALLTSLAEAAETRRPDPLLPSRAMHVGESWQPSAELLAGSISEAGLEPGSASARMTLTRVTKQHGRTFGEITGQARLALRTLDGLPLATPLYVELVTRLRRCLDPACHDTTGTSGLQLSGRSRLAKATERTVIELALRVDIAWSIEQLVP